MSPRQSTLLVRTFALGALLAAGAADARAQRTYGGKPWPPPNDSAVVVMLGTGMPAPNPERSGPSVAVAVGRRVFLFDAGPGVMRRVAAAGLPIDGPTAVFLTHLHSDHTLGLPDVIFTSWVMGRGTPLALVGPAGTAKMAGHIAAAWEQDIDVRTNGLEHGRPGGWRVAARDVGPGVVYDSAGVKITAISVPHGSWKQAFAYRVDTRTKSIVISGDTRYSEALAKAAGGVDVLLHEVYDARRVAPEQRAGGDAWPSYMKSFHASDVEVGRVAARARPKLVVLYHIVGPFTPNELVDGVRRGGYRGRVVVANDLDRY
jgi:ribonuclease Z